MKRIVFACVLMALVVVFNCLCLNAVLESKNRVTMRLDKLSETVLKSESNEKAAEKSAAFQKFWMDEHHLLCRLVRHELLDCITSSVSKFSSLALLGEKGKLLAEISCCKVLIEEIWDSERPLFRNIF